MRQCGDGVVRAASKGAAVAVVDVGLLLGWDAPGDTTADSSAKIVIVRVIWWVLTGRQRAMLRAASAG